LPRKIVQLANDRVRGLVRVAGRSLLCARPSAQLAVAGAGFGLPARLDRAQERGWVDRNFILTVRTIYFHAANLTYRSECSYRNFKVAHYPKR
jgi:hypothetical protein